MNRLQLKQENRGIFDFFLFRVIRYLYVSVRTFGNWIILTLTLGISILVELIDKILD